MPRTYSSRELRRTALRAVLIGTVVAAVIIGVFTLGWALGGRSDTDDADPQSVASSLDTTNSAGGESGGSSVAEATSEQSFGETEPDNDEAEPYTGPTLPLTLTELESRWNAAVEQAESLLTISELVLDLEHQRVTDEGKVLAPFSYSWDNVELRGWAHTHDERLDAIIVQGGRRCQFVTSADGELVEECQGSFEDTPEEGLRFFDLQHLLLGALHPGLDSTSITDDWLVVDGPTGSFDTVASDGYPPVVNGVRYLINYDPHEGYLIWAAPND